LRQIRKPNKVILSLALSDFPDRIVPSFLNALKKRGLEIYFSDVDYKVATKLLPTLSRYPEAVIVTIDDDRMYHHSILKVLVDQHKEHPGEIISFSARNYVFESSNLYSRINYLEQDSLFDSSAFGIFEGFTSVLYPPHALHPEVFNFGNFKKLTPCADDVWFQAMAILQGTKTRGFENEVQKWFEWPAEIQETQESGLFHEHLHANDWMVYRTFSHYGILEKAGIPRLGNLKCKNCKRKVWIPSPGEDLASSHPMHMTSSRAKAKKCMTCFNPAPKKVLCLGAYDYGNIGDNMYKLVLDHSFGFSFDMFFAADTVRVNRAGQYIEMASPDDDIDFDALIVGGGGILHNFNPVSQSIPYYMKQAIREDKPFFVLSTGMQTPKQYLAPDEAAKYLGDTSYLLKKASMLFPRSIEDYFLLRSVLGEEVSHKLNITPDIGYLYADIMKDRLPQDKKYITLIQTGSANVNMPCVKNKLRQKLTEYPGAELVVMNWGGVEEPLNGKDFKEWDLFHIDTRRVFPEAKIFIGDSLSPALKTFRYAENTIRESDLNPEVAIGIVAQSHYVISGRYHGIIMAKALGIPHDQSIFTYKCIAEEDSRLDIKTAMDCILTIKGVLESREHLATDSPHKWDEHARNTHIVELNGKHPEMSIPFIQSMPNHIIHRLLLRNIST
jgi:hypothetical protein